MPKLSNNTIWLDCNELQEAGLSTSAIHKACSLGRYKTIPNPEDGRAVLIDYNSLPAQTKKRLPSRDALVAKCYSPAPSGSTVVSKLEGAIDEALNGGFAVYAAEYAKILGVSISDKRVAGLAKGAAVVMAIYTNVPSGGKMPYYEKAIETLIHLRQCGKILYPTWDNLIYLLRKLKELENGVAITEVVKLPRLGNTNRTVSNAYMPLLRYLTFAYTACPMQLSYVQVHKWMEWQCAEIGETLGEEIKPMSLSWVRQEADKIRVLAAPFRRGMKAYRDQMRPYVQREDPTHPHDLWELDGTRLNLPYRDGNNSIAFATVVLVIDGFSNCCIGVGIGKSENRWVVMDALNVAVKSQGYLPAEILTDNFGRGGEMKDLAAEMENIGVKFRRSKVGNAKDKRIERFISTLQTTGLRWLPQYSGEGVKSKRKDARPAPEWLAEQQQNGLLPTFSQLPAVVFDAIAIANNHVAEGRSYTRRAMLETGKNELGVPHGYTVNGETIAMLFWAKTIATMRNGLLNITVNKADYSYRVREYETWRHYEGKQVAVRYDRHRPQDGAYLFDMTTNKLIDEVRIDSKVAAQPHITGGDAQPYAAKEARTKAWEQRMVAEVREMEAAAMEIAEIQLTTDYRKVQKHALASAEDMLMRQMYMDITDLPEIDAPDASELVAISVDAYENRLTADHKKPIHNLYAGRASGIDLTDIEE